MEKIYDKFDIGLNPSLELIIQQFIMTLKVHSYIMWIYSHQHYKGPHQGVGTIVTL